LPAPPTPLSTRPHSPNPEDLPKQSVVRDSTDNSNSWLAAVGHSASRVRQYLAYQDVQWYWLHRTGYKPYDLDSNVRIESAYRNGETKVRLKNGKKKTTPMEIFFEDMIQHDPISGNTRNVKREGPSGFVFQTKRMAKGWMRWMETGKPRREMFADYQRRRQQLRQEIDKEEYDVTTKYKQHGIFAAIARSTTFFAVSMGLVLLNAIWIAIDADYNDAPTLYSSRPHFQVVEHLFCTFFTLELLVRFCAFERKRDALADRWFTFDLLLAILMVLETWMVPLGLMMFAPDNADPSVPSQFTSLRMLRLLRLTRMARLLRVVPEALTLLRGITAAMRGVLTTMLILIVLLFIFGIIFKTSTRHNQEVYDEYFPTVLVSMRTLLMHATLLDGPAEVVKLLFEKVSRGLALLFLVFIFVSSFTVLNMLIGILCEVVTQVSQTEKAEAEVVFVRNHLLGILECYDTNGDQTIGRGEFNLLMQNIELIEALTRFGTDVAGLFSLADVLFEGPIEGAVQTVDGVKMTREPKSLSFREFMSIVLRLRGAHNARVTDIVELREYVRQRCDRIEASLQNPGHSVLAPEPEKAPKASGLLKVVIVSARGLRNADWMPGSGLSDVYCVCTIVHKPHSAVRTQVCRDTLCPVWNYQTTMRDYAVGDTLHFAVMDKDCNLLKADDSLGSATLSSSSFQPAGFEGELALSHSGQAELPYLRVKILPPDAGAASLSRESVLQTVLVRLGEISSQQQALRAEVLALRKEVRNVQRGASNADPGLSPGAELRGRMDQVSNLQAGAAQGEALQNAPGMSPAGQRCRAVEDH